MPSAPAEQRGAQARGPTLARRRGLEWEGLFQSPGKPSLRESLSLPEPLMGPNLGGPDEAGVEKNRGGRMSKLDSKELARDPEKLFDVLKQYGCRLHYTKRNYRDGASIHDVDLDPTEFDTVTATSIKKSNSYGTAWWGKDAGVLINRNGEIVGIYVNDWYYNNETGSFDSESYVVALKPVKARLTRRGKVKECADVTINGFRYSRYPITREGERTEEIELPFVPQLAQTLQDIVKIWKEEAGWIKRTSRGFPVNWDSLPNP